MTNIGFPVTKTQLKVELAEILHKPPYSSLPGLQFPMNLEVAILPPTRGPHKSGFLTLPTKTVGNLFLSEFGGVAPARTIALGTRIRFQVSNNPPRQDVLEEVRHAPYEDPRVKQERDRSALEVQSKRITLRTIQFGWEYRDNVFSVEWERIRGVKTELIFDEERREFHSKLYHGQGTRLIVIRASQIGWAAAGIDKSERLHLPVLFLSLTYPPAYETEMSQIDIAIQKMEAMGISDSLASVMSQGNAHQLALRQRWSHFEDGHIPFAPFASTSIRLVCTSAADLRIFRDLCHHASMQAGDFL